MAFFQYTLNIFNQKNRCMKRELLAWSCTILCHQGFLSYYMNCQSDTKRNAPSTDLSLPLAERKRESRWRGGVHSAQGRDKVKQILYGTTSQPFRFYFVYNG